MKPFDGTKSLRWESWDRTGLEHCVLRLDGDGILVDGILISTRQEGFACRYAVRFDGGGHTRSLSVAVAGFDPSLLLDVDERGRWTKNHDLMSELDYAIAPDLSGSAFTNTLAIRRLNLGEGEAADIDVAYVQLPGMSVSCDPQRYTCIERGRLYRYDSRDSDFSREIAVDADGFIVTYPGLFRRLM